MEPWQTLVANALVGTERQTPQALDGEGALKELVDRLDWTQPEGAVLGAAGAIALHQWIGQRPAHKDWTAMESCPPEELPVINSTVAGYLDRVMGSYSDVFLELLLLIARAGQRVPDRQIPRLLRRAKSNVKLRSSIAAVTGQRGQWLARQQPDWGFLVMEGDREVSLDLPQLQQIWKNGDGEQRAFLLQRWREDDPNGAREALETVWSTERVKERAALIESLAKGLTMADEPFLEAALKDRGQAVRQTAIELLARLPESRLCQRMADRIQQFVRIMSDGSKARLEIKTPEEYKSDWKRDGLPDHPNGLLREMLAAAPLEIWGPASLVVPAIEKEAYQGHVLAGFELAVKRQQRLDWAHALFNHFDYSAAGGWTLSKVQPLLAIEQQEAWLREGVPDISDKEETVCWIGRVARSKLACGDCWSLDFSRLVISYVKAAVEGGFDPNRTNLAPLKDTLHPDVAPDVVAAIREINGLEESVWRKQRAWRKDFLQFEGYLNLRQGMHRAFQASG